MAQFTPPNFPNPMVMSLLQDQQRQAQWERTQNARIQQEQRAARVKIDTEERKFLRDLGLEALKTGVIDDPSVLMDENGNLRLDVALQALAQKGRLDQDKAKREMVEPLKGELIRPLKEMSGLQAIARETGRLSPAQESRVRQISRGAGPIAQLAGTGGRQLAAATMGEAERRRQEILKERRTEGRLLERPFAQVEAGMDRTEDLQQELADMIRADPNAIKTPEFKRKSRRLQLVHGRTERAAFGDYEEMTLNPDGSFSMTKGRRKPGFGSIERVYRNVQSSDFIVNDIDSILDAYKQDQTTLGAAAAAQRFWNNLEGLGDDFNALVQNDVELGKVIKKGQESAISEALDSGNIMGLKALAPDAYSDYKEDILQGHRLTELRLAYYFVRMNRGNGRVTAREIADAMARLRLVSWVRSSRQVAATLRQFRFYADREAKRGRSFAKDQMDLEIPRMERENPWGRTEDTSGAAETPVVAPEEQGRPLGDKLRGAANELELDKAFEAFADKFLGTER